MRTSTHMTIQDYFRQSGHHSAAVRTENELNLPLHDTANSFARILEGKQSTPGIGHRGLSIRDYLAKPVAMRPAVHAMPLRQIGQDAAPQPAAQTPKEGDAAVVSESPTHLASPPGAQPENTGATDVTSRIEGSIDRAANRYNLPRALVRAVVKAESGFQVRAVSPAGAQGLMQLMPATAKELGVTDPFDINQNIDGGAKYLRAMLDRFDGDVKLALSAYNAGPGTVLKYNGNVPYQETRNYVERVLRFARRST